MFACDDVEASAVRRTYTEEVSENLTVHKTPKKTPIKHPPFCVTSPSNKDTPPSTGLAVNVAHGK